MRYGRVVVERKINKYKFLIAFEMNTMNINRVSMNDKTCIKILLAVPHGAVIRLQYSLLIFLSLFLLFGRKGILRDREEARERARRIETV